MKQDKQPDKTTEIHIVDVERGRITFCLIGTAPLLHNTLSNKARHQLLLPPPKKTDAERKATLKHQPLEEFRASIYRADTGPTLIQHLSSAFRGAMRSAALDLPDVTKAEVGRLVWVEGDRIDIYGMPMIDMRPIRQAGPGRTPDIRTRCIMPEWACQITVSFTKPRITEQAVANLLTAAGIFIGIGDNRNEKGAGNYGLFRICPDDEKDYRRIVAGGGRTIQEAAMLAPEPFNVETEELLSWFGEAVKKHRSATPIKTTKANGKSAHGSVS